MCVSIYVIYHKSIFLYNCRSQQTILVITVLSYNNELTLNFNEGSVNEGSTFCETKFFQIQH